MKPDNHILVVEKTQVAQIAVNYLVADVGFGQGLIFLHGEHHSHVSTKLQYFLGHVHIFFGQAESQMVILGH